ncbi:MAG: zinc ABC transporter substrate-binding protein [Spirochaetes bacterium]|nr:zinc ABC transporter substrate-binding protein [Spirochaetota bacterium]
MHPAFRNLLTRTSLAVLLVFFTLGTAFAAGQKDQPGGGSVVAETTIKVFVSLTPYKYFVERIGGSRVQVETLVEPGRDPHTFDPSPRQIARLGEAQLFLASGMPFEEALTAKLGQASRSLDIVSLLQGLSLHEGHDEDEAGHDDDDHEADEAEHDDDEDDDGHDHDGADLHVWLGIPQVRQQAVLIRDALISADATYEAAYRQAWQAFDAELAAMDSRFAEKLAPLQGRAVLVFHPAFSYFVEAYGLEQKAIELDGKEPSPRYLEQVVTESREHGTRVVFTQPEFPLRSAQLIANAIGGRVVTLNPLDPNWPAMMESLASAIAEGAY